MYSNRLRAHFDVTVSCEVIRSALNVINRVLHLICCHPGSRATRPVMLQSSESAEAAG